MYERKDNETLPIFQELFPLGGGLRKDNPWIKLAELVPWERLETIYQRYFSLKGRPSKDGRLILGLLIAKHLKHYSDREVVQQFSENPYLQYFCGYSHFITAPKVIHPSLLSKLRKKLGNKFFKMFEGEVLKTLMERKIINAKELMLDATIFPANIAFPTDCKLINQARETACAIINKIRKGLGLKEKLRTGVRVGRKIFLNFTKRRRKGWRFMRKTQGQLLRYLRRNIRQAKELMSMVPTLQASLLEKMKQKLEVLEQIFAQQNEMWQNKTKRVKDRIVSLHLPRVRPMVRGKDGKDVEFGPKGLLAWVNGFAFLDFFSFDAFNEALHLPDSVEQFSRRFGRTPTAVIADGIFGTRDNRRLLADAKIEVGLKPLGRPPSMENKEKQRLRRQQRKRSLIEGIIGVGKNCYGLDRILYRIPDGEEIWVRLGLTGMNMQTALQKI